MPKARLAKNKGLPMRWSFRFGAYYYSVPKGLESRRDNKQLFRLGKTLPDAYREWSERLGTIDSANTIGDLLDRYMLEVVPTKAPMTQKHNQKYARKLRPVFGSLPLTAIQPKHIYQYVDRSKAKVLAHREVKMLSPAYTKAVEWGYLNSHPFKKKRCD